MGMSIYISDIFEARACRVGREIHIVAEALVAFAVAPGMAGVPMSLLRDLPLAWWPVMLLLLLVHPAHGEGLLTDGFTAVELSEAQFKVQKPYDVPLADRYELTAGGVRRMWVYATDKPITTSHPGGPRTEIKIEEIYSSGVWQFEGYGYIPCGTSGASVMQIFGAAEHATTLMLHVYDGRLTYYHDVDDGKVVDADIYDRWFRLNVIHDVAASNVTVFVDGEHRLTVPGRGGEEHYFKFGVYGQTRNGMSYRMESWWRDVKVFTKKC